MLTILLTSPMRMRRSSFVPRCARLELLLDRHHGDAAEHRREGGRVGFLVGELGAAAGLRGLARGAAPLPPRPRRRRCPRLPAARGAPPLRARRRSCSRRRSSLSKNSSRISSSRRRPSAVEIRILEEGVDQGRLAEQPHLVDDERLLRRPADARRPARSRVWSPAARLRMMRSSTKWSSLWRLMTSSSISVGSASSRNSREVVGRNVGRSVSAAGGPISGSMSPDHREQRPQAVVALERKQAAGREDPQLPRANPGIGPARSGPGVRRS